MALNVGNIGFENFILYALNSHEDGREKLMAQASVQGISMSTKYVCAVFRQTCESVIARRERKAFVEEFQSGNRAGGGRLVFLEENEGALILEAGDAVLHRKDGLESLLNDFTRKVELCFPDMHLEFGIYREERPISEIRVCIEKCRKAMELGRRLYSRRNFWEYEKLGAFAAAA